MLGLLVLLKQEQEQNIAHWWYFLMSLSISVLGTSRKVILYFLVLCERKLKKNVKKWKLNESSGENYEEVSGTWAAENRLGGMRGLHRKDLYWHGKKACLCLIFVFT